MFKDKKHFQFFEKVRIQARTLQTPLERIVADFKIMNDIERTDRTSMLAVSSAKRTSSHQAYYAFIYVRLCIT